MIDKILGLFSHDLGIDLGTANTLVFVRGKGIAVREPSVVARHKKSGKVLAIGDEAKKMLGRAPQTIEVIRPLQKGVIADLEATESMLLKYIRQMHQPTGLLPLAPRPRVVIGVPSGVSEVERRAVKEAAVSAQAREVYIVDEPTAAAIGADLPIQDAKGRLIIDIGGGTTEIAVISLGGIVIQRSLRIAGDQMDQAIVHMVRLKYGLVFGVSSAEEIKIQIGNAHASIKSKTGVIRGRDLETGLPKSIKITSDEIREALAPIVGQINSSLLEVLEETPPELVSDILLHGVTMAGGGSQLQGLDKLISEQIKMPVWIAEDPAACVVRGCGKLLDMPKLLKRVRLNDNSDPLSSR